MQVAEIALAPVDKVYPTNLPSDESRAFIKNGGHTPRNGARLGDILIEMVLANMADRTRLRQTRAPVTFKAGCP